MSYECLKKEAREAGAVIVEKHLFGRIRGLYHNGAILIDKRLRRSSERLCILAEELGHHHTTAGDILDQSSIPNRKQELRARQWAYRRLVPLERIVEAHKARIQGRHELAEFLGVTEPFLQAAINRYTEIYGLFASVGDRYLIRFDPLGVVEFFE